jgi:hypothetical protein
MTRNQMEFIVRRKTSLLLGGRGDAQKLKEQTMNSFEATPRLNPTAGIAGKLLRITLAASVLAIAGAAPAFAASRSTNEVFANDVDTGGVPISAKRAAAVHDCSVRASKFNFSTFETTQLAVYGECMTEHNEIP